MLLISSDFYICAYQNIKKMRKKKNMFIPWVSLKHIACQYLRLNHLFFWGAASRKNAGSHIHAKPKLVEYIARASCFLFKYALMPKTCSPALISRELEMCLTCRVKRGQFK